MDPSLRNWGLCKGVLEQGQFRLTDLSIHCTTREEATHRNVSDFERIQTILAGVVPYLPSDAVIFAEMPTGSQSARAMFSYGVVLTVLASLKEQGYRLLPLSPREVKQHSQGNVEASKEEMIHWAAATYPSSLWPVHRRNGQLRINASKAEHMADAVATVHAGLKIYQNHPFFSGALP